MYKDAPESAAAFTADADCPPDHTLRILRLPAVVSRVGLSRSSIYNRMRCGAFPRAVNLGGRAIGFAEHEIDRWVRTAIQQGQAK